MFAERPRWVLAAIFSASLMPFTLISGPAAEGPKTDEKDWPGLHAEGKPFPSMNLKKTKAKVDFFYHGPDDRKPHLEGRVLKETKEAVTVGISVWKQDVAFSAYDKVRKVLEIYLTPHHLKDPKEVRILIVPKTEFTAPPDIRTVRVIYLP